MELDQKIRYAMLAVAGLSLVLSGLGLHLGVHIKLMDTGGIVDGQLS
jgi:hypothetical protein